MRRMQPLDLGLEAHVGHAVGLVDDDGAHARSDTARRDTRSMRRPGVATMTSTPRLQGLDLLLDVGAAVERLDAEAPALEQRVELPLHLDGELAGGHRG